MSATGLLAPILVLATVVERVMEVIWSSWEQVKILALEALIKTGTDQVEKERLANDPDYVRRRFLDDPGYKERKRILTLVVGSLLGILLCIFTGVRFFEMTFAVLQMPQPMLVLGARDVIPFFDVLLTGLIIGAGSQPAHALINWVYFAQSVQKEVAELRRGERTLSDLRILNEALTALGIPPQTITDVLKLMEQNGVKTLDDLIAALKAAGSAAPPQSLAAAESIKAAKSYLDMTGRSRSVRLMP